MKQMKEKIGIKRLQDQKKKRRGVKQITDFKLYLKNHFLI